jgi:stress response protein SCP2
MNLDFSSTMDQLQLTVPKVEKGQVVSITKSGNLSGMVYFGMRWDSLDPTILKKFIPGSNGSIDVDTCAIVLNSNYKPARGSWEASSIRFNQLTNSELGMIRSKDDREGSDNVTDTALDINGKTLTIDGRNADDERGYIDLNKVKDAGGKYVLITADIYAPMGASFSTLKLRNEARDGEAWMRICDASTFKSSILTPFGEEPPTLVGNDLALIDLDELGKSKGALLGFFVLNDDNYSWSWVTRTQDYKAENQESYKKVFAILDQAPVELWNDFFKH